MNHRQLEVFRAVIWANGITAAAKALNVSQPAVSRTISDLEYSVGFKLFRRVGNRATPTDEARLFLEEVDRSFVGLEALKDAAYEIRTLVRGSVRVSSSVTSSLSTLPGATRKFLAAASRHSAFGKLRPLPAGRRAHKLTAGRYRVDCARGKLRGRRVDSSIHVQLCLARSRRSRPCSQGLHSP